MKTILVTGGAGFIGANFLNLFVPRLSEVRFVNVDKLTYAGNPDNTLEIRDSKNYAFERVDIADREQVDAVLAKHCPDVIIHFAAESHVDRSIAAPDAFVQTNIVGTFNLLEACRGSWASQRGVRFHHVSTDEVYGSLGDTGAFTEETPYDPRSPYSASKAASDHLVRAYFHTYGLPVTLTNCSNNYGPYQFPEKLIPLMILNAAAGKPLPIYGAGCNVRDWLHVSDHCEALWRVVSNGKPGQTYNIGGNQEKRNIDVARAVCHAVAEATGESAAALERLITYVPDRPGHDQRYAIDASKMRIELGWEPKWLFEEGLRSTVAWYLGHPDWVERVRSGAYQSWVQSHYGQERGLAF